MNLAVLAPLAETRTARHLAFEYCRKGLWIDRPGQPEFFRALAHPGARFLVCGVVLGVVAVALEVGDTLRRRSTAYSPPHRVLDKHESVRESQYCSDAYQARLGELGFLASMSGKGNCYDNAVVETFFKTIKSELIWRTVFMSRSQAETAIARYIDGFYNPVRRHSTLDFTSPVKFEAEAMQTV